MTKPRVILALLVIPVVFFFIGALLTWMPKKWVVTSLGIVVPLATVRTIGTVLLIAASGALGLLSKWFESRHRNRMFAVKRNGFDALLARYNPYYRSLSDAVRDRFLHRVMLFVEAKEFKYIDIEPEERMPLLIGAAAVQLTFGLDHFLLDHFKTIHIIKDKYRFGLYNMPFEGHVSEDGIYLSWAHFLREFTDYSDGQNVGLHEMAHALTYVNFTVREGRDDTFHDQFVAFSAVARPIFDRMQAGESTLLDSYAATNYQEFWAVCVETFFERSTAFKRLLPDLYSSLCILLNQDPLTPNKILITNEMFDDGLAGNLAATGS